MTERASDLLSELSDRLSADVGESGLVAAESVRSLAPEILKAILRNRHPIELSAKRLANEARLPVAWQSQRALLGIG